MIPSPFVSTLFHSILTLLCALAPNTHTHTRTHHTRLSSQRLCLYEFWRVLAAHATYSHDTHVNTHTLHADTAVGALRTNRQTAQGIFVVASPSLPHTQVLVSSLCVCVRLRACVCKCVFARAHTLAHTAGGREHARHARRANMPDMPGAPCQTSQCIFFFAPSSLTHKYQSAIAREYRFPTSLSQYPRLLFFFQIACT